MTRLKLEIQQFTMKARMIELVLTIVLLTAFSTGVMAQSGCTNVLISLSPCLDYITGNTSTPSSGCCTQLATVVGSQPRCLCEVINNSSSLGIDINQTRALALPKACNVQTPPVSRCNASSPAASPIGNPGSTPGGDSSDGNTVNMPFVLSVFIVSIASHASTMLII